MQIGCHGLLWSNRYADPDVVDDAIRRTAQAGFDLLELPLMDVDRFDAERARKALEENDLRSSLSVGHSAATDISSDDVAVVAAGARLLHAAADVAGRMGATHLVGNLYSELRKYPRPVTPAGYANAQRVLSEVGAHAEELGLTVGLEIVNRYETNVFNTIRGCLAFLEGVTSPVVKCHIDAYHMNIEETDLYSPVLEAAAAGKIGYVHVGDSHRGYLGSGSVNLPSYFAALVRAGWDGPVTFETFSPEILGAELGPLLALWRPLWTDPDDIARHANAFIRAGLRAAAAH